MIPVTQRYLAEFNNAGDNVKHGDCLTACIASLFELPIDAVPFFVDTDDWWGAYQSFAHHRGLQLANVRISVDEEDPTRLRGRPSDGIYWIATVKSPRGKARCTTCGGTGAVTEEWDSELGEYLMFAEAKPCPRCAATGFVPPLHAVVMCGGELVWDPHPQRELGHLGFVSGEWFIVRDPGQLALKEPVDG